MLIKVLGSSSCARGADGVRIKKGEAYGLMLHRSEMFALSGRSVDLRKAEKVIESGEVCRVGNKGGRLVYV